MLKGFLQYLCCCHFAGISKKYESFQRFYGEKKIKTFRFPKWEIIICLFGNRPFPNYLSIGSIKGEFRWILFHSSIPWEMNFMISKWQRVHVTWISFIYAISSLETVLMELSWEQRRSVRQKHGLSLSAGVVKSRPIIQFIVGQNFKALLKLLIIIFSTTDLLKRLLEMKHFTYRFCWERFPMRCKVLAGIKTFCSPLLYC